jgi:hypothetical protein
MKNVLHYKIFDSHVYGCKYSMIIQEKYFGRIQEEHSRTHPCAQLRDSSIKLSEMV